MPAGPRGSRGDGRKTPGLLPRLTLAASSLSPTASPLGRHLSQLNSRHCFTLERQPQPSSSSPVIDVTAVLGAAPLIFNADSAAAERQARRAEGPAESPRGREEGTDGKGLPRPESPQQMGITPMRFSPWLNSERARAARACRGTRRLLTEPW